MLIPVPPSSLQIEDTALAATSSLPTLFILLFATAFILCDLQPYLPPALRSRTGMQGFAIVVVPLVPIGFVGALIGSFLLVTYSGYSPQER